MIIFLNLQDTNEWFIKERGERCHAKGEKSVMLSVGIAATWWKWFAEIHTTHQEILRVSHPIRRRRKLACVELLDESTEHILLLLLPCLVAQQSTFSFHWKQELGSFNIYWKRFASCKIRYCEALRLFFLLPYCAEYLLRASTRKQRQRYFLVFSGEVEL